MRSRKVVIDVRQGEYGKQLRHALRNFNKNHYIIIVRVPCLVLTNPKQLRGLTERWPMRRTALIRPQVLGDKFMNVIDVTKLSCRENRSDR